MEFCSCDVSNIFMLNFRFKRYGCVKIRFSRFFQHENPVGSNRDLAVQSLVGENIPYGVRKFEFPTLANRIYKDKAFAVFSLSGNNENAKCSIGNLAVFA